jgi:hypothetical protein
MDASFFVNQWILKDNSCHHTLTKSIKRQLFPQAGTTATKTEYLFNLLLVYRFVSTHKATINSLFPYDIYLITYFRFCPNLSGSQASYLPITLLYIWFSVDSNKERVPLLEMVGFSSQLDLLWQEYYWQLATWSASIVKASKQPKEESTKS